MRNVYHHFNLRLSALVATYIIMFGIYVSLPSAYTELRHALSLGMLMIMILAIILAFGTLRPTDAS